ncbi:TonB-dependent receptor-like protein [Novosphingobium sp. PhB165]|nr:TonB-dependent receptor-like protein [Novosphingobium sp. PhB165]
MAIKASKRICAQAGLLLGAAVLTTATTGTATARGVQMVSINIPVQPLAASLTQIGRATSAEIIFTASDVRSRQGQALRGSYSTEQALSLVLQGTGLIARRTPQGAYLVQAGATEQAEPVGNAPAEPVTEKGVSEIIVTARKRDERAVDVPVAISALSGADLERYATNSLTAISERIPQLVIGESTNQTGGSINLRGIGAGLANPSTEQAVTLNIDGIPISYGNAVRLGQFDLQRVEVLKGPQALFYGKNSPGGIISLISADPGSTFDARLRTGYEFAANQRFAEGIVSGPLSRSAARARCTKSPMPWNISFRTGPPSSAAPTSWSMAG